MSKKYHIEELRNMLECLELDAEFLYRYGSISSSLDLLARLNYDDKRRLIALALLEGNDEVKNVARKLMGKLEPRPNNLEQLKSQLSPESQLEVETFGLGDANIQVMTETDRKVILQELQDGCNTVGFLDVEEAWWILIPENSEDGIQWIEAMGGEDELYNLIRSRNEIGYRPSQEDMHELLSEIRNAKWVLHIHNHPGESSICMPSTKDFQTALSWKQIRPELARKMRFFVIQANIAVEYATESGRYIRWL